MKKIAVLTLCLVGLALADPTSVVAQCSTGTSNFNADNLRMVGEIPGGTKIHVGQQFSVDCAAAQLQAVTFRLQVDANLVIGAQTCLALGDTVACVLMDLDHNELARVEQTLDFTSGTRDVTFDFSNQTYGLDSGDYVVTWENVTKSFLFFARYGDHHSGFMHVNTNGVWTEDWASDAYFAVTWDENGVPNDQLTWGALKADYR